MTKTASFDVREQSGHTVKSAVKVSDYQTIYGTIKGKSHVNSKIFNFEILTTLFWATQKFYILMQNTLELNMVTEKFIRAQNNI